LIGSRSFWHTDGQAMSTQPEAEDSSSLYRSFNGGSAIDLVRDTFKVISRAWPTFLTLFAILLAIWFAQYCLDRGALMVTSTPVQLLLRILGLATWLFTSLTTMAAIKAADVVSEGGSATLLGCCRGLNRRLWPYLLAQAIVFVVAFSGAILFVVPGLVFTIGLSLAATATIAERHGASDALARSWYLTAGAKMALFIMYLILTLVALVIIWTPAMIVAGWPGWSWVALPPLNGIVILGAGASRGEPIWFVITLAWGGAFWTLLLVVFKLIVFKALRADRGAGLRPLPRWPALLATALGLLQLAFSIPSFLETWHFTANAVLTTGTLTSPITQATDWGATVDYATVVEYVTSTGEAHRIQSMFTMEGVSDQPVGTPIPVLYDAAHPEEARIAYHLFIWGGFYVKCVIGLILSASGLAQWFFLHRRSVPGHAGMAA
jgi:hypothetical protein